VLFVNSYAVGCDKIEDGKYELDAGNISGN